MTGKHVILFAGTTEGRVLANWLDDQPGITGTVCVATKYGAELLTEEMPLKHLKVHCGRLDEDEIEAFLKKNGTHLVIDATHPYAQVVTANIRKACEKFPHICLLRCLRRASKTWRTHFYKSSSCGSFHSYLPGAGIWRKAYYCNAGPVFRRNELCAVKGISLFLHGNKRRGRYRRL